MPKREIIRGTKTLPSYIRRMQGRRNALNRCWQRETNLSMKDYYKAACDDLTERTQREITRLTNERFGRAVQKINDDPGPYRKKYWKLVRYLKSRPSSGTPILLVNGNKLVTNQEKSEALANHFQSIHDDPANGRPNRHSRDIEATRRELDNDPISNNIPPIRLSDLEMELSRLNNRKAPGLDLITNRCLRKLPKQATELIRDILNAYTLGDTFLLTATYVLSVLAVYVWLKKNNRLYTTTRFLNPTNRLSYW